MPLSAKDHKKLLDAGFTIIRESIIPDSMVIKYKSFAQRNWANLETGFTSKAALRRRMDELLKSPKAIEN